MRTIRFFHVTDGMAEAYPVVEARKHRFEWYKTMAEEVRRSKASVEYVPAASKCPAIIDINTTGYFVPLDRDIFVNNRNGRLEAKNASPKFYQITEQVVHPAKDYLDERSAMPFVLKVAAGWHCICPPELRFYLGPIPYPDNTLWYTLPGLYTPRQDFQINFQGLWNTTENGHKLKAGTPMVHLVPLTNEKFRMSVGPATPTERYIASALQTMAASTKPIPSKLMQRLYMIYASKIKKEWKDYEI